MANATIAGFDNGDNAELFAIVWDPVREASYSLDLGVNVNDFRISAQQDAGVQRFWKLDAATDANFASLRALGTAIDSLRWAVLAFDAQNDTFEPGDIRAFLTVQQGSAPGALNPSYVNLTSITALSVADYTNNAALYLGGLNMALGHSPGGDLADFAYNGSSFDVKGMPGYFGGNSSINELPSFYASNVLLTNAVGKSSWFYGLANIGDSSDPAPIDEFDNIAHDGYFGLALNPADGSFALSYTLEAATRTVAQREFAFGIGRSEINGGFAVRKLAYTDLGATAQNARDFTRRFTHDIATPGFALPNAVLPTTAVPEPQTWALMLAGALGLVGHVRRRRLP